MCGIYRIRNMVTGEFYIGQSIDISQRWGLHRTTLRRRCHHNPRLQAAWIAHGEPVFTFEVLESCPPHLLYAREGHWVAETKPTYNGEGIGVRNARRRQEVNARRRRCEVCPDAVAVKGERFCRKCRGQVIRSLREARRI